MSEKLQKSKWRRFCFFLFSVQLFVIGTYANSLFHVDERLSGAGYAMENQKAEKDAERTADHSRWGEDIRETLAGGEMGQGTKQEEAAVSRNHTPAKTMVYASGEPVGIYIRTDGVLVLGTQEVKGENGRTCTPAKHKLESGDYILAVNGEDVTSKQQFISFLQKNKDREAVLTIRRKEETQDIRVYPVYSETDHCYQIGAWIRNDTQGIGTVTYIMEDGSFAALGHGISDCDLGVQLDIAGGSIYETDIAAITKGKKKDPGEIIGTIDYISEKYLGVIGNNTVCGIFGKMENRLRSFRNGTLMEVAGAKEIRTGKALLRTSVSGKSRDYTIEIEKISLNRQDAQKALRIKVTDPELVNLTGGIIQGLSGSPIIQNGKLIGAVTHVFVDDPTRGYGICAETMMEESGF